MVNMYHMSLNQIDTLSVTAFGHIFRDKCSMLFAKNVIIFTVLKWSEFKLPFSLFQRPLCFQHIKTLSFNYANLPKGIYLTIRRDFFTLYHTLYAVNVLICAHCYFFRTVNQKHLNSDVWVCENLLKSWIVCAFSWSFPVSSREHSCKHTHIY